MDRSDRFTLFPSPGRPVHADTNSASPGGILAMQLLRANTKSLIFPPLSIVRYSFKQRSQPGCQWRERKCPIFVTVAKGDSNPGSLYCESYHRATALHKIHKWDDIPCEAATSALHGTRAAPPAAILFAVTSHLSII